MRSFSFYLNATVLLSLPWLTIEAQTEESQTETPQEAGPNNFADTKTLGAVTVIGSKEAAQDLPGSATFLDAEDIRRQSYGDVNQVLRQVPGVYLRQEDGFGLFPNISLRGVDTSRSAKVTIMEDGVLSAPAPYSAPSAYYTPNIDRMSGIEVLKGSSQIKYGPHITGGVINFLSTPIPLKQSGYLRTIYGSEDEIRVHGFFGDTLDTPSGRFGYLIEGYFRESDGFKTIDETPDFLDGDQTGFSKAEPMIKLAWEPNTEVFQRFEFKYGYSDFEADETYLGLSEADFDDDPNRRYAASRFDNFDSTQNRTYLRYIIAPNDNLDITTTAYSNDFERDWFRLNRLEDIPDGMGGLENVDLSAALAGSNNGIALDVLRGDAAGTLRYVHGDREYYLRGIQSEANYRFDTGTVGHELNFGVRFHEDEEDRFQQEELFTQQANGTISDRLIGIEGAESDRKQTTETIAVFVRDTISFGRLAITPGIRYEHLDQTSQQDLRRTDGDGSPEDEDGSLDLWGGGVGVVFDASDEWTVFGGVHRGFSPPSPRAAIRDDLEEETSLGYEIGARFLSVEGAFGAEATAFYTEFDDLIVVDNVGGAGTGESENIGKVDSYGLELAADFDAGIANGWSFRNPYFLALTYTNAEFASDDANSADAESIFSGGEEGNELPYIPEIQLKIGAGLEFQKWGGFISGTYVDETFTSGSNTSQQVDAQGNPDARFGKTDDFFLVDISAYYQLRKNMRLIGGVNNVFDEEYIASRQPHGPRPGQPLFAYVGAEIEF